MSDSLSRIAKLRSIKGKTGAGAADLAGGVVTLEPGTEGPLQDYPTVPAAATTAIAATSIMPVFRDISDPILLDECPVIPQRGPILFALPLLHHAACRSCPS